MKKGVLFLGVLLMLVSCGEYQKVLKSEDIGLKYATAEQLYNEAKEENSNAKYRKALRLFEQIVPQYRGKPQGEKVTFLFADTYYQLGDDYLAGYQFERFTQAYPNSEKIEEAAFKSAKSYFYLSPRYDLDQTETYKAITELQKYIDTYPDGENMEEANKLATELRVKLEKKAYKIAWEYYNKGEAGLPGQNYKASIVAFSNFLNEYPGSPFREEAFFYRFAASYELAVNSYEFLLKERMTDAQEYYKNYIKYYKEGSPYYEQIQALNKDLETRLQNF